VAYFDVFNGDADGLCALHQLRLHYPCDAALVTGTKRDIGLLDQVSAQAGDSVTVLDLSADANAEPLQRLLDAGVRVTWFDHHSVALPTHRLLRATVSTDAYVCTSVLVDRQLDGRYRHWAVVGAYGDNLPQSARVLARSIKLPTTQRHALRRLGTLLNYNAYGDHVNELIIHPAELYQRLHAYVDALMFCSVEPVLRQIETALHADLQQALSLPVVRVSGGRMVYLPGAPWGRRVIGTLANHLARDEPMLAHAVLVPSSDNAWRVSVRAPMKPGTGADQLCRQFTGGGGRAVAAGIDALPDAERPIFIKAFEQLFASSAANQPISISCSLQSG
jgi:hypothetical protein